MRLSIAPSLVSEQNAPDSSIALTMAERRNKSASKIEKIAEKDPMQACLVQIGQLEVFLRAEMAEVMDNFKRLDVNLGHVSSEVQLCSDGLKQLKSAKAAHHVSFGDKVEDPPSSTNPTFLQPQAEFEEAVPAQGGVVVEELSGEDLFSTHDVSPVPVLSAQPMWTSEGSQQQVRQSSKLRDLMRKQDWASERSEIYGNLHPNAFKPVRKKQMGADLDAQYRRSVSGDSGPKSPTSLAGRPSSKESSKRASFSKTKSQSQGSLSSSQQSKDSNGGLKAKRPSTENALAGLYNQMFKRTRERKEWEKKLWLFLDDPESVAGGHSFVRFMAFATIVSAFLPFLQTVENPPVSVSDTTVIDLSLDGMFLIEVIIRLIVCPNRLAFFFSVYNFIDLIAGTLPLALRLSLTQGMTFNSGPTWTLGLVCAVPLLRMLKLLRRFETFHLVAKAFKLSAKVLPVLMYILTIIILFFSSMIFMSEPRSNVESMPAAIWLTVVTVGTVGYGDIVPATTPGTVSTIGLIVTSALYMAIPIGIIGKAFGVVWDERDRHLLMHRTKTRLLTGGYKASDIPAIFCSLDADGDGEVSLPEFIEMMRHMELNIDSERIVALFRTFDSDGNGTIDDREFVRMLFPSEYAEIYGRLDDAEEDEQLSRSHELEDFTAPRGSSEPEGGPRAEI
eukprot:TRINITY_DN79453_c0_g1_i1.p1 TRINITY_DN79453_c0_g1~~TRINITY_DN79453_c0_g1_i1.p1  ORF type:complete len:673 (-),score=111.37 TRINITY_DN79453_c0_g1_i1:84-2102(-)